jgi:hypothetical protein
MSYRCFKENMHICWLAHEIVLLYWPSCATDVIDIVSELQVCCIHELADVSDAVKFRVGSRVEANAWQIQ